MVNKGIRLFDLSKLKQAQPYFDDVIKQFDGYEDVEANKKEDMAKTVSVAKIYSERINRSFNTDETQLAPVSP
jgi:hypothetical protein